MSLITQPLSLTLTPDADLHLYIDMSGSTYAQDWTPVIVAEVERLKALSAELGKTLILWVTAFSHEFANNAVPVTVTASYPNPEELGMLIEMIPTVYGGTNFQLVWNRINNSAEHSLRDNVIVSDLDWFVDSVTLRAEHPVNLRYIALGQTEPSRREYFADLLSGAGITERITTA